MIKECVSYNKHLFAIGLILNSFIASTVFAKDPSCFREKEAKITLSSSGRSESPEGAFNIIQHDFSHIEAILTSASLESFVEKVERYKVESTMNRGNNKLDYVYNFHIEYIIEPLEKASGLLEEMRKANISAELFVINRETSSNCD